jgi:hypothetical protein
LLQALPERRRLVVSAEGVNQLDECRMGTHLQRAVGNELLLRLQAFAGGKFPLCQLKIEFSEGQVIEPDFRIE